MKIRPSRLGFQGFIGYMLINRSNYINRIKSLLSDNPIVALIGPRQVGKTTLARQIAADYQSVTFFDLEEPLSLVRLTDPMLALSELTGLIIIDEVQHQPDLFKILRVIVDRGNSNQKFLILGSASPVLLRQSSESLAGRIAYVEIEGFSIDEVGVEHLKKLWLRGGFPRSYLANSENISFNWRQEFIKTFLERDLPQLGIQVPAITMRRFWMMIAHYHGQIWNASEFARAFGMSDKAIRHYLDILSSTLIIRQLPAWWENISKRQVKAPKIFINDSGLLHALLGLRNFEELESHPKIGASWEGFAMNNIINQLNISHEEAYFWNAHSGAEIDLLIIHGNKRLGFEFKRAIAPSLTKSIHTVIKDLRLTHVYIINASNEVYKINETITSFGLSQIDKLQPLNPVM